MLPHTGGGLFSHGKTSPLIESSRPPDISHRTLAAIYFLDLQGSVHAICARFISDSGDLGWGGVLLCPYVICGSFIGSRQSGVKYRPIPVCWSRRGRRHPTPTAAMGRGGAGRVEGFSGLFSC